MIDESADVYSYWVLVFFFVCFENPFGLGLLGI